MALRSILSSLARKVASTSGSVPAPQAATGCALIFDGDWLVDSTPDARLVLGRDQTPDALLRRLAAVFPTLPKARALLHQDAPQRLAADDLWLGLSLRGPVLRIEIGHTSRPDPVAPLLACLLDLRDDALDALPLALWQQDTEGTVTWSNRGYQDAYGDTPPNLSLPDTAEPAPIRAPLAEGGTTRDIHAVPWQGGLLAAASDAGPQIRAEESLRTFVQTLSKLFAHLSVGLAVFDRDRKLALFNPALSDLTTLPASALARRPCVRAFFDQLRERRMVPEVRDFQAWRDTVLDVGRVTGNGTYRDTWHLPLGQTFHITCRPQSDGALALLFEDVTGEVALTRRFRAQIDTAQAVIDRFDSILAVFGPDGALALSNEALDRFWGVETMGTLRDLGLPDLRSTLADRMDPSAGAAGLLAALRHGTPARVFHGRILLSEGAAFQAAVSPLGGGMTLLALHPEGTDNTLASGAANLPVVLLS